MGKSRRSVEENKRISAIAITFLIIILITWLILLIYILFAKVETNKELDSVKDNIEVLKLESNNLNDKKEEVDLILSSVENSDVFVEIKKENYKATLPLIEEKIKSYETKEKIAYLTFIVDKNENVDKAIEILQNNNSLATFFTDNKEAADKIIDSGNLIGLYINDEKKIETVQEDYKDIIESYKPDLFMVSSELKDKDIAIESFYKVVENSTAEGKKLLNQEGYTDDIVETTAERDFLIIRINLSNSVGVNSISGIISKLKEKDYIFLPLISASSMVEK